MYISRSQSIIFREKSLVNENASITPLETRTQKARAELHDNLSYKLKAVLKGTEVQMDSLFQTQK
jgi:hypothetical protein